MTLWQYFCLLWGLSGLRGLIFGKNIENLTIKIINMTLYVLLL